MRRKILFVFIGFLITLISHFWAQNVFAESGWGFKRNLNHETPDIGKYQTLIEGTSSYYVGNTNNKEIYLTFDAGYDNGEMEKILDILKEKKVRATFFLTGDFVNRFQDLTIRLVKDGHVVGSHSYYHRPLPKLSMNDLKKDLDLLVERFYEVTNTFMSSYFRPPAGAFDRQSLLNVQALGYKTIFWSIAFQDWNTNHQRGIQHSYDSVIDNLHNGAIILLHTVSSSNRQALGMIIDEILRQGYQFKTVQELQ